MKQLTIAFLSLAVSIPLFAQASSSTPAGAGSPQTAEATTPPAEQQPAAEPHRLEAPASAPAKATNMFSSFVSAGVQGVDVDTNSSKFQEYRDVPEGLAGPSLRLFGSQGSTTWLLTGEALGEDDRRVDLDVDAPGIGVSLFFDQIPHRLGNDAHSVLSRVAEDAWGASDLAQLEAQQRLEAQRAINPAGVNPAFLAGVAQMYTNTPYVYDLGFDRKRAGISFEVFPEGPVDARVSYFQENRDGTREAGTSFGFANVVETGEPIDYVTREAGVQLETPFRNGLVRGAVVMNDFRNRIESYTFDNPWRAIDTTDPNAYTGPAAGSINGPSSGRMSLAPDSQQLTVSAGGMLKLPMNSRLTADVSWAETTSSQRLIPFTTNTAIFTPAGEPAWQHETLPIDDYRGDIKSLRGTVQFTMRPVAGLNLQARYRTYDLDNESPRVRFEEGYVRFDAVWEDIPRITVPYGWTNDRLDLLASYDFGMASIEGGYRHDTMERTFRETRETTEGIFHVAADFRPASWLVARTSFEFGSREYDEYDPLRSEEASFLEPETPANLLLLRRYDQAERDTQRIVAMVQAAPFDALTLSANYIRYFDDYANDPGYGLLEWRNQSLTLEADYTPTDRWNLFAFWTRDTLGSFQRGRQSGGTLSTNPADDWTADISNDADSFGVGGNYNFIPDRLSLTTSLRMQRVNGYNDLDSPPGGAPDFAVDIPNLDDTRLLTAIAELTWKATQAFDFGFGGWFEKYSIDDAAQDGMQMFMPGGFFLVPDDRDYRGVVAYVRSTYHF